MKNSIFFSVCLLQWTIAIASSINLNTNLSVDDITFDIYKNELPNSILYKDISRKVSCKYMNVESIYDKLFKGIALGNTNIEKSFNYFFNSVTTKIDFIISCDLEEPLTDAPNNTKRITANTPWYNPRPSLKDPNMIAEGRMLTSISNHNKGLVFLIGHMPCKCNTSDTDTCERLLLASRRKLQAIADIYKSSVGVKESFLSENTRKGIIDFVNWHRNDYISNEPCDFDLAESKNRLNIIRNLMIEDRDKAVEKIKKGKWWWPF